MKSVAARQSHANMLTVQPQLNIKHVVERDAGVGDMMDGRDGLNFLLLSLLLGSRCHSYGT